MARSVLEIAREKKKLSVLMEGREKLEPESVENEVLTLIEFELVDQKQPYVICIFEEYPDKFMFGGMVLTELCIDIMNEYGANTYEALNSQGGLQFKIVKKKARKPDAFGRYNSYFDYELLEAQTSEEPKNKTGGKK